MTENETDKSTNSANHAKKSSTELVDHAAVHIGNTE